VWVVSRDGRASIERRSNSFRYITVNGDPLGLSGAKEKLVASGKVDAAGFIPDEDWFAATVESDRPDVIKRVYEGATDYIQNQASVIVSFEDGYYSGSFALDIFAFLQATHGNVMREQSFGFVMSTSKKMPAYIRGSEMWAALGAPDLVDTKVATRK
jgi:hypothetical protein